MAALRPAFGSGEDWNPYPGTVRDQPMIVAPGLRVGRGLERDLEGLHYPVLAVAPGLRVGRGLELEEPGLAFGRPVCCARPSGRARIGTYVVRDQSHLPTVAPGLRVGRGLEPDGGGRGEGSGELRPAFGSGEDWNGSSGLSDHLVRRLRPAFGSGEDWNPNDYVEKTYVR